ncbi:hypothetical protein SKC41_30290 [Mycobacterium sp. 050128]|uniref:hypothetical protein n=1 Tax=Mycobacterium sp. 050128 TaxID=3096112 RepID=UPI002EDAF651
MDHEFELAFELLDTAIELLQHQQYGNTTIEAHNHGDDLILTSRHTYSSSAGHKLTLLATYKADQMTAAAVEITAPDLDTTPHMRIVKVYAADLMFHAGPGDWIFRAQGRHRYTITAGIGDEPLWSLATDTGTTTPSNNIAELVDQILTAESV